MPITKFFMVPSILAGQAYEDMWICSIVNLLLDLFTLTVLMVVCKRENTDFITLLKNKLGKKGAKIDPMLSVFPQVQEEHAKAIESDEE